MALTTDAITFDGKMAWNYGWGYIAGGGPAPDPFVPSEVQLPVLPASECPGEGGSPSDTYLFVLEEKKEKVLVR